MEQPDKSFDLKQHYKEQLVLRMVLLEVLQELYYPEHCQVVHQKKMISYYQQATSKSP